MAKNTIFLVAPRGESRTELVRRIRLARQLKDTIVEFDTHESVVERAVKERPELVLVDDKLETHAGQFVVHLRKAGFTRSIVLMTNDRSLVHSHGVDTLVYDPLNTPCIFRALISAHLDAP